MKSLLSTLVVLSALASAPVMAATAIDVPKQSWPHDGVTGTYDRAALQRGYQVYKEVCAACHSLQYVAFRNLMEIGFTEAEVKALAAEAIVIDGPNDDGEMFERPGRPSDRLPSPFRNEKAARAANNGAYPPDLSLIVKAKKGGADYIYALLTGYEEAPADFELMEGMSWNRYFPGHQIAMAQPLFDGQVAYADGTDNTLSQQSRDLAQFLSWAAEPYLEERKQMGIKVVLFLLVFSGVLLATKRKVWTQKP